MNETKVGAWRHTVKSECIIGLKICMDSKMCGFTDKLALFVCFSAPYVYSNGRPFRPFRLFLAKLP
jgi:hypothetical protein